MSGQNWVGNTVGPVSLVFKGLFWSAVCLDGLTVSSHKGTNDGLRG